MEYKTSFLFCVLACVILGVSGRSIESNVVDEEVESRGGGDTFPSFLGEVKNVFRVYSECASQDLSACLKVKLVSALDRATRSVQDFTLMEGVSFVRDPTAPEPQDAPKNEAELEATLPRSLNDKDELLDGMILDRAVDFMKSHTLQVKLPNAEDLQRSFSEEGRKKKMSGLLLLPLMMGAMTIPLLLGGLALLAGKALLVSKLALVLSAVIGLKKLLGGGGGGHDSGYQVVSIPGGHGHYGRSLQDGQQLVYRGYAPAPAS